MRNRDKSSGRLPVVVYEQSIITSSEDVTCRLERAFTVLFEETLKNMSMKYENEYARIPK